MARRSIVLIRSPLSGILVLLLAGSLSAVGCQQQMAKQPSYRPLEPSSFFANGQSSRNLVAGTVARGHLEIDSHFFTGRIPGAAGRLGDGKITPAPPGQNIGARGNVGAVANSGQNAGQNAGTAKIPPDESQFVESFPFPITVGVLEHGYQRYMIYCVVCHDPLGTGRGKIVERGYTQPPSYHIDRLRKTRPGRLFAVITEGYGSMPSYAAQISPRDRWAIAAYVRTLQLSQHFPSDQLSPDDRKQLAAAGAKQEGP